MAQLLQQSFPLCPPFPHLLQMWCLLHPSSIWLHFPSFHLLQGSSFFQFFPRLLLRPPSSLDPPDTTETPMESMCAILRSANFSKLDSSRFLTLLARLRSALPKEMTWLWTLEWVTEKRLIMYSS